MVSSCIRLTKRVLKLSLADADANASFARERLTPASSNTIVPPLRRETHLTTSPLPLPILTSVGFFVTGMFG